MAGDQISASQLKGSTKLFNGSTGLRQKSINKAAMRFTIFSLLE
jgi:hypothetical protein